MRIFLALLMLLALASPADALPLTTLNFSEGVADLCTPFAGLICLYQEQGYTVTPLGDAPFLAHAWQMTVPTVEPGTGDSYGCPACGTTLTMYPDFLDGIRFTRDDGTPFTLVSVDLLSVHPDAIFVSPSGVSITYTPFDVFTQVHATGGFRFSFGGAAWQDIAYFDIVHGGNYVDAPTVIDNIRLAAVKVTAPHALLLLAVGLVGAAFRRCGSRNP